MAFNSSMFNALLRAWRKAYLADDQAFAAEIVNQIGSNTPPTPPATSGSGGGSSVASSTAYYLGFDSSGTPTWYQRTVAWAFGFETVLTDGQIFGRYIAQERFNLPAQLAGSFFNCQTAPASDVALVLKKIVSGVTTTLATITIAATTGTVTVTGMPSAVVIDAGTIITCEGPTPAGTAAKFTATFVAQALGA